MDKFSFNLYLILPLRQKLSKHFTILRISLKFSYEEHLFILWDLVNTASDVQKFESFILNELLQLSHILRMSVFLEVILQNLC